MTSNLVNFSQNYRKFSVSLHQKCTKFDVAQTKFPSLHQRWAKFPLHNQNSRCYVKSALPLDCAVAKLANFSHNDENLGCATTNLTHF